MSYKTTLPVSIGFFTLLAQVGIHSPMKTEMPRIARFLDEEISIS